MPRLSSTADATHGAFLFAFFFVVSRAAVNMRYINIIHLSDAAGKDGDDGPKGETSDAR
jgi:hypothetical protein